MLEITFYGKPFMGKARASVCGCVAGLTDGSPCFGSRTSWSLNRVFLLSDCSGDGSLSGWARRKAPRRCAWVLTSRESPHVLAASLEARKRRGRCLSSEAHPVHLGIQLKSNQMCRFVLFAVIYFLFLFLQKNSLQFLD